MRSQRLRAEPHCSGRTCRTRSMCTSKISSRSRSFRRSLAAIAAVGLRAKVRTGGVEAGAFPASAELARFLSGCVAHDVTFKAKHGSASRDARLVSADGPRHASERGSMFKVSQCSSQQINGPPPCGHGDDWGRGRSSKSVL